LVCVSDDWDEEGREEGSVADVVGCIGCGLECSDCGFVGVVKGHEIG